MFNISSVHYRSPNRRANWWKISWTMHYRQNSLSQQLDMAEQGKVEAEKQIKEQQLKIKESQAELHLAGRQESTCFPCQCDACGRNHRESLLLRKTPWMCLLVPTRLLPRLHCLSSFLQRMPAPQWRKVREQAKRRKVLSHLLGK